MKKFLRRSCGAFTMADRLSRVYTLGSKSAFTMAEILISLTIIGVIAAITLPSLRANINEKTWATQKKALLSRISQAIAMMDAQNSYADAQDYVTSGLSEVLKINNICDGTSATTLADCGISSNFIDMGGSARTMPITWGGLGLSGKTFVGNGTTSEPEFAAGGTAKLTAAFETQNGESVLVFYNPDCIPDNDDSPSTTSGVSMLNYACANIIYDLNQDKGPNTMGKDIGFMTVFYASDSVVASGIPNTTNSCTDGERLPNLTEGATLALNWTLTSGTAQSATLATSGRGMALTSGENPVNATWHYGISPITTTALDRVSQSTGDYATLRCIKR